MVSQTHLPTENDKITQLAAPGHPHLPDNDTVPPDPGIVADLNQVIDLGALPNHSIPERSAVDGRACADFNIVLNDDPSELRNLLVSQGTRSKTETRLSDLRAGKNRYAVADVRMRQRNMASDVAITPDRYSRAYHGVGANPCPAPNISPCAYDRTGRHAGVPRNSSSGADRFPLPINARVLRIQHLGDRPERGGCRSNAQEDAASRCSHIQRAIDEHVPGSGVRKLSSGRLACSERQVRRSSASESGDISDRSSRSGAFWHLQPKPRTDLAEP